MNYFQIESRDQIIKFISIAVGIGLLLLVSKSESNQKFPEPKGAVNDYAEVISPTYVDRMERMAREILKKTETSIVVVTVKSIGDENPDEYANRLYATWGIGKKGEDKGILIFLAVKERRIRIETGYGVEGILPDGLVGEILDKYTVPYLKDGNYGQGLANAVFSFASVVAQNANVSLTDRPAIDSSRSKKESRGGSFLSLIFLFLIIVPLLGTRRGRAMLPIILYMLMSGGGRGRGGGFGSFGGGGFGGFGGGLSGGGGASRGF
ncbi:MAG: TPM domain-containing protein [Desulfobacterales bacterium]|nr:TPM domain-containing protein [Desulfobacterales bacterium]